MWASNMTQRIVRDCAAQEYLNLNPRIHKRRGGGGEGEETIKAVMAIQM